MENEAPGMPPGQVTKIGKYDVQGVLGQGGMGVVYKGVDSRIGRSVAIKMMHGSFSADSDALRRFYREAQSVGVLQHPNIVTIYDLGDENGTPYLVMEYLEGEPLDKLIASRREISIVEKLHIVNQVLQALHYAHQHKIVHRDVKPGNVMVLRDGHCKLVDFGIARGGSATLTHTGQIVGSLSYMSPEQLNGYEVDGRTDVWSAAVMFYEVLTGHLPFAARDTSAMIVKVLNENPPPLSNYLENYPKELDQIIARALAKDREQRYRAADEFAFDLAHVEDLLKAQMVSEYVERARASMSEDPIRARELLSRVLKVDTQNSTAKQLLYQVQQLMHQQQRGEQVAALRARAEEALNKSSWEEALSLIDQGLKLDQTNADLAGMREAVLQRKSRKEQVLKLVHLAEAAQRAGELDMAQRAVDDALGLDPNDTQAKVLASALTREIEQRRRFEQLLKSARDEAGAKQFTRAAQLVMEAETLCPKASEIAPLKNLITAGREDQLRRQRFEELKQEAEQLLAQEQFIQAQAKAEEALRFDPSDRAILSLIERAKSLQQEHWTAQQLAAADKLVAEGRITAAISLLETAAAHFKDPRLQAQIPELRQKQEQQRAGSARAAAITSANEACRRSDYAGAISTLERALSELGQSTELENELAAVRTAAAEAAKRSQAAELLQRAQRLLDEGDFEEVEALLSKAIAGGLKDDGIDRLLEQARQQQEEFKQGVERAIASANAFLEQRKPDDALALLEGQPSFFSRSSEFRLTLDRVRTEQKRKQTIGAALEESRRAMQRGDLEQAWQLAQDCRTRYGDSPEIAQVAGEVEAERTRREQESASQAAAENRNRQIEEVRRYVRAQIERGELEQTIAYLESVAGQLKDDGIDRLLVQARSELDQLRRGVDAAVAQARKLLAANKPGEAIALLESQPQSYRAAPAVRSLLEEAQAESERQQAAQKRDRKAAPAPQATGISIPPPPSPEQFSATGVFTASDRAGAASSGAASAAAKAARSPREDVAPPTAPVAQPKAPGPPAPGKSKNLILIGAVAAVLLVAGLYVFLRPSGGGGGGGVSVHFEADPAGTDLSVDGQHCSAPCELKLKPGTYKVNGQHDGYAPVEKEISVGTAPQEVSLKLNQASVAVGKAVIESNVDQFQIYVDGALKDVSDGKKMVIALLPGSHEIGIRKRAYEPAVQKVEIPKDGQVSLSFTLKPGGSDQPLGDPNLIVRSRPGAKILVDGATVGSVPGDGRYSLQFKPGTHRLEVALSGFDSWSTTLTAKPGDNIPVTAELKETPKPPPAIVSFAAGAGSIQAGQSTELRWQTKNAGDVVIDHGVGSVPANGQQSVNPSTSTTYTITAKGQGQPAQSSVTITVAALAKPSIALFDSGSDSIQAGQATKLAWATQNAAEVYIEGVGNVEANGSREVRPSRTTTYVLTAKSAGGSVSKSIQINVASASAPAPSQSAENQDPKAVRDTIEQRYKAAYESLAIDQLQKVWPSMTKQQRDAIGGVFKMYKGIKAHYSCQAPSIEGDSAHCACTESVIYTTAGNKQQPMSVAIVFDLKKNGGVWYVQGRRGQ